jgi:hypothetical protein
MQTYSTLNLAPSRPRQAKELLDHLEGVLSNEPVEVVAGAAIIEVKPQGVSKGGIVERILTDLSRRGPPDFVLCIGDDRSDEDMFTAMEHVTFSPHLPAEARAPAGYPNPTLCCRLLPSGRPSRGHACLPGVHARAGPCCLSMALQGGAPHAAARARRRARRAGPRCCSRPCEARPPLCSVNGL